MGGAAGDMILASLLSAGASVEEVEEGIRGLGLSVRLELRQVEISGIDALALKVVPPEEHVHRTFADIRRLIEDSDLSDRVAGRALEAFRLLAAAEGRVHGVPPEQVTFHEVGAADSIADIVGTSLALELLGVQSASCGPLPMGSGVVRAAHGPLPVPGPATLEVLRGCRVRWPEEEMEMTTPTGAALMRTLTGGEFSDAAPPMVLSAVGYGAGTVRLQSAPNLLRAVVGRVEGPAGELEVLEANVDDVSGEILGSAVERLLEAGAPDAWLEPIVMKRGRGAYKLCVLARRQDRERLAQLMMRETGSLGVRHHPVGRTVAERRIVEVELPYGRCRVKIGSLDGRDFVVSPEHADATRLARGSGVPLPRVYDDARRAALSEKA
ncbi:UPF0272 protein [Rubrobacter xylanophilus]|uniref:Pyridinium-3,5-bisthiocarboxylic acid mononucleotide nickel insertion protein n=1 Tax=Rubrobacter xylanophilus TaxID=49319 RepID=A0A510HJW7_9ACTN|nr:nickel pincer cofactor biosynthesis protein LarC [Rubrobacter xylanophilus]BBL80300.1 UPF0272 protein [Rubrobacter xylanophilus]